MSFVTRTLIAAALAAGLASPAAAGLNDLAPGGGFKIHKAQLAIKGPAGPGCPAEASLKGWVYMSHQATVQVMILRKGKSVGLPVSITSQKASNGQYVATITQQMSFSSPGNWDYRMLVGGGSGTASNWVPLAISC